MRRLLALLVPLVVLAGCGDDRDDAADGPTSTVRDAAETATESAASSEGTVDGGVGAGAPEPSSDATVPLDAPAGDGPGDGAGDGEGMGDAVLAADLDGSGPVPGPGHAEAVGRFEAELVEGVLCADAVVTGLGSAATGVQLHRGPIGEAGPLLVDLGPPSSTADGASTWTDVCTDVDDDVIATLADAPEQAYVDVRSGAHPDGAVRGQLAVISIFDRTLD